MVNYGIAEFLGCMFFLPVLIYLTFAIFDGLGIFKDIFEGGRKRTTPRN
jgi:hypothetical protein